MREMEKRLLLALFMLPLAFLCWLPTARRYRRRNIMLVSEKGVDARDNGYHFFRFVKQRHPEIECYYVISDNSPDRHKLECYSDSLITHLSFRHCLFFWRATYLVGTHLRAGHTPMPFALASWAGRWLGIYRRKKLVNIKHGITKGFIDRMVYENTRYNLLVCGAYPEVDFLTSRYHYPPSVARYTGFCRFDNLMSFTAKRQILVMPTWRSYLTKHNIAESDYCKAFTSLLSHPRLMDALQRHDVNLVFYPHHMFQSYLDVFKKNGASSRIVIADAAHYDVQTLLKESSLLVTDYSSVYFDFVYMRKPVIFYQFDYDDFTSNHIGKGYDSEASFGPVFAQCEPLVDAIIASIEAGMTMQPQYAATVERYFPIRDQNNCQRVFDAVMHC